MPREDVVISIRIRRPTSDDPAGYLGAVSSHAPRPGEDWRRGNDLADGACTEATLLAVMDDVRAVMEGYARAFDRDNPSDAA